MLRILWLCVVVTGCALRSVASDRPLPVPTATLDLSPLLPAGNGEPTWTSIAYLSDEKIGIGLCRYDVCTLSIVRWESGSLTKVAQTSQFASGVSIHSATDGRVVTVGVQRPSILFSPDLFVSLDLSKRLARASVSGKIVVEWETASSWKIYRLTDTIEPVREVIGDLQSVSDELAVVQHGKELGVETLDGKAVSSFSLPNGSWSHAALLGNAKLYVDDCTKARIVDFVGKTQVEIHPWDLYDRGSRWFTDASVCNQGEKSSADGSRILFDFFERKVGRLQNLAEGIRSAMTLGMTGPEDVNREEVRVLGTASGKSCFSWHRSFPSTYVPVRSAAISPSGDSIAIAVGNTLSIHRLPAVCEGQTGEPHK